MEKKEMSKDSKGIVDKLKEKNNITDEVKDKPFPRSLEVGVVPHKWVDELSCVLCKLPSVRKITYKQTKKEGVIFKVYFTKDYDSKHAKEEITFCLDNFSRQKSFTESLNSHIKPYNDKIELLELNISKLLEALYDFSSNVNKENWIIECPEKFDNLLSIAEEIDVGQNERENNKI